MRCRCGWIGVGLVSGFCSTTIVAAPLGTAFTYQGQLKEDGRPLDGTADFQFTLWDAAGSGNPPTGGTQVGGRQAINALSVTAGLFTAPLNAGGEFGGSAFNGSALWLQIAVRSPAGGGVFTTLAPRQPLTPAPHAVFALNAASATNATTATSATNATLLDNLDSTAFLQSIPVPLVLSGSSNQIIRAENASAVNGISAVYGLATGATNNYGVFGQSDSTQGRGVSGVANATSGGAYGGQFQSNSTGGRGVSSRAVATSGVTYGVFGESVSTSGVGVYGSASANTGATLGVYGESESTSGVGVKGLGHWGLLGTAADSAGYGGVFSGSGSFGGGNALLVTGDSLLAGTVEIGQVVGNLGIGTSTPAVKLQVEGGTDSSLASGGYLVTGTTTGLNISIDNNEIMARNNGQVATLTLNAGGGDVVVGGTLDINYTIVTSFDCRTASSTSIGRTEVLCPAGLKVLGGGCQGVLPDYFIQDSYPLAGGTGWHCTTENRTSIFSDGCHDNDPAGTGTSAWAICAKVK